MTTNRERVPLLVGAGGGGLAHGPSVDDGSQHGNEQDKNSRNQTGDAYGESPAGNLVVLQHFTISIAEGRSVRLCNKVNLVLFVCVITPCTNKICIL